jgi:hypothetical protein
MVVMKSSIFWDVMPCSWLTFNRLYGVIFQMIELLIIVVNINDNISILATKQHQNIKCVFWCYCLVKTVLRTIFLPLQF